MFTLNKKDSSTNNVNEQYINFIKNNHNMVEKHLQTQFQHPYKRSLLKSHGIIPKQKDLSYKLNDNGIFSSKNQYTISPVKNRYDERIMSMKTIQSKQLRKQPIFKGNNNSLNLSPIKQSNKTSRKQQICNSLNFINPPSGKSLQVGLPSQSSKRSQNHNIIQRNDLISREEILNIVDEKNKQISQQLLKQRNNFSQIVYKNNHHSKGNSLFNQQKKGENYVLERYENNRTSVKANLNQQRYSKDQILSDTQLASTLQQNSSSNLLLPSIKKRSQSYRNEPYYENNNKQQKKLLYQQQNEQDNQVKTFHKQNKSSKQSQSTSLTKSINQLRKQFQQNSDAIKMYKKVEKNNIALKVKQINEKNLKSYYEYESSIVKNSQIFLSDKEGKNKNNLTKQEFANFSQKERKLKALFNDKLIQFSLNDLVKQKINLSNQQLSQEQIFVRQIAANKSEQEVRRLLGSTISSVVRYKMMQSNQQVQRYGQQTNNTQSLAQSQLTKSNQKSSTPLSPSKRFKKNLKNIQSQAMTKTDNSSLYQAKINSYRQFGFKIFFTHKKFSSLLIKQIPSTTMKNEEKFKFYVGNGNNSLLIKSLMKRRFWWVLQQDPKKANFVWTQLKINSIFTQQKKAQTKSLYYKVESKELENSSSIKKIQKPNKKKDINNQQKQKKSPIFKAPLPLDDQIKIFTSYDKRIFQKFSTALNQSNNPQKWLNFDKRKQFFPQGFFQALYEEKNQNQKAQKVQPEDSNQQNFELLKTYKVHNHFQFNHFMGNKKALFYNLRYYYNLINKDVYEIIPLTFHIRNGQKDPQYNKFLKYYKAIQKKSTKNNNQQQSNKKKQKNIWIIKPGQNSNRGQGIQVFDQLYQLNNILKQKNAKNPAQQHTYIVQKYIEKPLLYKNRKFDIRHYFVLTRMWGKMKAYFFGQGYIRTSSYEFDLNNVGDTEIHLTNDAIQKYADSYGKYEEGNKLSYVEFQRYLDQLNKEQIVKGSPKKNGNQKKPISFANNIYPQMRNIATEAIKACYIQMDPNRTQHNFEVFGLDFMIDRDYKVWLIEINTNPCLELSSKLLQRVIPSMVQQSLRLTIDILFPQPYHYPNTMKHMMPDYSLQKLKFELIFDQDRDGKQLQQLFNKQLEKQKLQGKKTIRQMLLGEIDQQDQTYENDGNQLNVGQKQGVQLQ